MVFPPSEHTRAFDTTALRGLFPEPICTHRECQNTDNSPAALPASKSPPSRTIRRHRREKRPSSRPTTGTSARLVLSPTDCNTGNEANGPSCRKKTGDSSAARGVPDEPNTNSTTATAERSNAAAAGGATRRGGWNFSTCVDDLPPDALLRKHPGWDVAARGREAGVRMRSRGGLFFERSTARTITTISSSSALHDA